MIFVLCWCVCGVIGGLIGQQHGKVGKGFILGFLLGPIGWALMLFDVSLSAILFAFLGMTMLGFAVFELSLIRDRDEENRARAEASRQRDSDPKSIQQRFDALTVSPKPSPSAVLHPTPYPTVPPTQLEAQKRQREALEIARKYATPR